MPVRAAEVCLSHSSAAGESVGVHLRDIKTNATSGGRSSQCVSIDAVTRENTTILFLDYYLYSILIFSDLESWGLISFCQSK